MVAFSTWGGDAATSITTLSRRGVSRNLASADKLALTSMTTSRSSKDSNPAAATSTV